MLCFFFFFWFVSFRFNTFKFACVQKRSKTRTRLASAFSSVASQPSFAAVDLEEFSDEIIKKKKSAGASREGLK